MKIKETVPVPKDWNQFAASFKTNSPAPTFKIFGPDGKAIGILAFTIDVDDQLADAIDDAMQALRNAPSYRKLAVSK